MGLVWEEDRAVILTDILGLEDALGDMDFKVAGTRKGSPPCRWTTRWGPSREVLKEALLQAREARLKILDLMEAVLPAPRPGLKPFAPRILTLKVPVEKIGLVIGSRGKNVRALSRVRGGRWSIERQQRDGALLPSDP